MSGPLHPSIDAAAAESTTATTTPGRRRCRLPHRRNLTTKALAAVVPCCLLLARSSTHRHLRRGGGCHGLSMAVLPAATTTRIISETLPWTSSRTSSPPPPPPPVRRAGGAVVRVGRKNRVRATTTNRYRDADALSAALFDVDDQGAFSSLESAVSLRRRAEAHDRFAEEEHAMASMVRGTVAPGGVVDEARRGADVDVVVDAEEAMRREAVHRRRDRDLRRGASSSVVAAAVGGEWGGAEIVATRNSPAPGPFISVVRKSKLVPAAKARSSKKKSPGEEEGGGEEEGPRYPGLLTREREYELARTIQSGARAHKLRAEYESAHSSPIPRKEWARLAGTTPNDLRKLVSDYRRAKEELVSRNVGLVRAVVRSRYARRAEHRGVPIDELIQEGSLGLIRAAELFDPSRGLRFSTYATIWIKGVLSNSNSLDEVISLPSREKAMYNKVRRAWGDMATEAGDAAGVGAGGRPGPSSAEGLASRLGMETSSVEGHLRRMACVTNVLSLDYRYASSTRSGHASGDREESLRNNLRFGTDADLAERAQLKADVVSGLVKNLTERELTLMRLRYGLEDGNEYTLKECSERMGINKETARLLQHACLKKLREASNMESLQEYLLTVA